MHTPKAKGRRNTGLWPNEKDQNELAAVNLGAFDFPFVFVLAKTVIYNQSALTLTSK